MPVVIDERATEKNQELIKYAYDNLKNIPKGHDEYEKMISGLPYDCLDDVLCKGRVIAHEQATDYGAIRLRDFNSFESFTQARFDYLTTIFGKVGDQSYFEPPFFVDYGYNTSFGKRCYVNFNFTVLDCSLVKIGDDCLIAPNVTITTATHPTDPSVRLGGVEYAKPITIGNHCWLSSNVVVLPGVTIGDGVTIGAGAVVSKDIPSYSVAVGIPARVVKTVRNLEEAKAEAAMYHTSQ